MIIATSTASDNNYNNYQILNQSLNSLNNLNNVENMDQQPEHQYEIIICNNELKRKFSNEEMNMSETHHQINVPINQVNQCKLNKTHNHYVTTISENNYQHQLQPIQHQDQELCYTNLTVMSHPGCNGNVVESSHVYQMDGYHIATTSSGNTMPSHWHENGQMISLNGTNVIHSAPSANHINQREISSQTHKNQSKSFYQSDMLEDTEDKNLSWLMNFKLDDIANLSPEIKRKRMTSNASLEPQQQQHQTNYHNVHQQPTNQQMEEMNHQQMLKDHHCIEDDEMNVAENVVISNTTGYSSPSPAHMPKKPPFTYTELIEHSLEDKGELTVSGIYQWISDRFAYYKSNDDRWKNSVRHNLSINPHFRKGSKAPQGAGHLWTISSRDSEANFLAWEHKKQRLELFFKMEAASNTKNNIKNNVLQSLAVNDIRSADSPYQDELNAATASILLPMESSNGMITTHADPESPGESHHMFAAYQEMMPLNHQHQHANDELRRSAGEILNGVRRNVEVQIMHPNDLQSYSILSSDYLNPISKEEIVQESGLGYRRHETPTNEYYVTSIDPIELGINMGANNDEEILFHEFNSDYFGNNIIA